MKRYYVCLSFAVAALATTVANAQTARASTVADRVVSGSPYAIKADAEADAFVTATAEKAYAANCAGCHGADMHGKAGVPDLTDFEFIWGITGEETSDVGPVAELEQTIRYGVRNQDCPAVHDQALYGDCPDTRYSEMPAFAALGTLTTARPITMAAAASAHCPVLIPATSPSDAPTSASSTLSPRIRKPASPATS